MYVIEKPGEIGAAAAARKQSFANAAELRQGLIDQPSRCHTRASNVQRERVADVTTATDHVPPMR